MWKRWYQLVTDACPIVLRTILGQVTASVTIGILRLDLCFSRLPCAVLPRQKGSGADHTDLVWRSEPFPAHCLPSNQWPNPHGSCHAHSVLVEVWKEWKQYDGMKGPRCSGMRSR